jgi:phosphohistidine phosphatase SixA
MQLYVVRHGSADRHAPGGDAARALTEVGVREVEGTGRGLAALGVALDALFASPLRRAQETARLLAAQLGGPEAETQELLDGGAPAAVLLRELAHWSRGRARIAIVGHQPVLGELVALASAGLGHGGAALAPATVARIDFPGPPRIGSGQLVWLLPADVLARIA